MDLRRRQIALICDYIKELPKPENHKGRCKKEIIQYEACLNWAAKEILSLVLADQEINPVRIIEEFIVKMDEFSCVNASSSRLFSACKVLAEDLLEQILYAMPEEIY